MIVVDTSVIASFWLRLDDFADAERLRNRQPHWVAPLLWRYEFRSVIRKYLLGGYLDTGVALAAIAEAEADMAGNEHLVDAALVLDAIERSGHSSYDCEFVALARHEDIPLVTRDRGLVSRFPDDAVLLSEFEG